MIYYVARFLLVDVPLSIAGGCALAWLGLQLYNLNPGG